MGSLYLHADTKPDYAGWTDKITGEQHPVDEGVYRIVQYEPLGVCAGIAAWNGSLVFHASKIAAAVASGNTVSSANICFSSLC